MKLFENEDFEQAILGAAEHFRHRGLRPAIIEKDYYVTEALRIIALAAPDKIIFKGGTSLAKGWNLIQRFSEDIDIFLDPLAFRPPLGKNADRHGAQETPRCRRRPPGAHLRRGGEQDHRWIRTQRPFLLSAALRRPRRSCQPRPTRSRHRQRSRTHHHRRATLLSGTVP